MPAPPGPQPETTRAQVPRSRRWLAAALDALEAGLAARDDEGRYRGPLFVGGADEEDEAPKRNDECTLQDLPRLLDAVLAKLHHLHVDDDVDVATFYDAAPRGPSLVRRLFERVRRACPGASVDGGAPRPATPAGEPIRVGFFSGRLRRSPAVRLAVAAAAALGRDGAFRTVACCFPTSPADEWTRAALAAFAEAAPLPADGPGAARVLVEARLDVLLFVDLPLDARALPFASKRFARVQAALVWAHFGGSPGLPQLDYYLGLDGAADQSKFAEQVVRLRPMTLPPDPPALGERERRRGADAEARRRLRRRHAAPDAHLFVVPAALDRLAHPAGDGALAAVLAADPKAVVVVAAAKAPSEDFPDRADEPPAAAPPVAAALQRRICTSGGWSLASEACGRLRVLRPLPVSELRALARASVAVLDPTVAGHADGLLLAAQEHAPVVSRRSGVVDALAGRGQALVADDDAAFGRAALRLATQKDLRRTAVAAARANADALFGGDAGGDADDLRAFLAAAAGRHPRAAARAAATLRRRAALVVAAAVAAVVAAALTLRALRRREGPSPAPRRRRAKGRL